MKFWIFVFCSIALFGHDLPHWMEVQIERQFTRYNQGFCVKDVQSSFDEITSALYGDHAPIAHVRLHGGKCEWALPPEVHSQFKRLIKTFAKSVECLNIPHEVEFLLCLDECCERPLYLHQTRVPILAVSKSMRNDQVVVIPRRLLKPSYTSIIQKLRENLIPWEQRKGELLWRLLSFQRSDIDYDWRLGPTMPLFYLTKKYRNVLNVGIPRPLVNLIRCKYKGAIMSCDLALPPLEPMDYQQARYLLSFDQRATPMIEEWLLASGSTLLRAQSPFESWYTHRLEKDVHFVEIPRDLSSLLDYIAWCEKNPKLCQTIALNAAEFAARELTEERCNSYFLAVIEAYARLLKGTKS